MERVEVPVHVGTGVVVDPVAECDHRDGGDEEGAAADDRLPSQQPLRLAESRAEDACGRVTEGEDEYGRGDVAEREGVVDEPERRPVIGRRGLPVLLVLVHPPVFEEHHVHEPVVPVEQVRPLAHPVLASTQHNPRDLDDREVCDEPPGKPEVHRCLGDFVPLAEQDRDPARHVDGLAQQRELLAVVLRHRSTPCNLFSCTACITFAQKKQEADASCFVFLGCPYAASCSSTSFARLLSSFSIPSPTS